MGKSPAVVMADRVAVALILASLLCLSVFDSRAAEVLATLDYRILPEASGLAVSAFDERRIWFLNDSGNRAELIAYDLASDSYTRVKIAGVENRDWEDLAVFKHRGTPWLAIGDVGDNNARRREVEVYLLPEPRPGITKSVVHTTLTLRYPDGPRDVESLAVDTVNNALYLLSKRDRFPHLYRVDMPPLGEEKTYSVTAELLGELRSIPAPGSAEIASHRYGRHRAQPTAMTLLPDGSAIALMTYRGAYLAELHSDRNWLQALNESLCPVDTPVLVQGESIAADAQRRLYLTSEGRAAPLLRLPALCAE